MKVLTFSGSLRKDSLNKKLARESARLARELGHDSTFLDLKNFEIPVYDGDIEALGIPEDISRLSLLIQESDVLVLSTPEYNGSIPGVVKNLIDWLSRIKPCSITGKPLLLLAASPGALGGVRGLWHTRVPFEVLGTFVYPEMFGLSRASDAFNSDGQLQDASTIERVKGLLSKFLSYHQR